VAQFCQIFARAVYVDGQRFVIEPNLSRRFAEGITEGQSSQ
jgi:hypothetical protein